MCLWQHFLFEKNKKKDSSRTSPAVFQCLCQQIKAQVSFYHNSPWQWSAQWSGSMWGGRGWWRRPDWSADSSCSCRRIQTDSTWGSGPRGTAGRTTPWRATGQKTLMQERKILKLSQETDSRDELMPVLQHTHTCHYHFHFSNMAKCRMILQIKMLTIIFVNC